jgi:hypothetical protein
MQYYRGTNILCQGSNASGPQSDVDLYEMRDKRNTYTTTLQAATQRRYKQLQIYN